MALGSLSVNLEANIARFMNDMDKASYQTEKALKKIQASADSTKISLQSMDRIAAAMKTTAAGVFAGIGAVAAIDKLISVQRQTDVLSASLITATGSSKNAAIAFKALQDFAQTTPFALAETVDAFVKMRNLGLDPSEAALRSYGNTAAAMGKSLNQFIEAVADASTSEFERLKEFGVKSKVVGDQVTFTFQGLSTSVGNNAAEIQGYLKGIGDNNFSGAMSERAKTVDGAISNMSDNWDGLFRQISTQNTGGLIYDSVSLASDALTDMKTILAAISVETERAGAESKKFSLIQEGIAQAFEAVAVLGVNVSYVFKQVGNEIGGIAAQAAALATGDFSGVSAIQKMMVEDSKRARKQVEEDSARILNARKEAAKAGGGQTGGDRLSQFAVVTDKELDKTKKLQQYLKELSTPAEKMAAEIKKAKTELGGLYNQDIENRIKAKYASKSGKGAGLQISKADLTADIDILKNQQEIIKNIYAESERFMEAKRSAGLLTDKEYYESKAGFIQLNSQQEESALESQIARLEREKLTGKDAIDNERNIQAAKSDLQKLRDSTAFKLQINAQEEESANQKVAMSYMDAQKAAEAYLETINKQVARAIEGVGKGTQFRDYQNGINQIEDKFTSERQALERDQRNGQITKQQFDQYLGIAQNTYQREVEAYRAKDDAIKAMQQNWRFGAEEAMNNYYDNAMNTAKSTEQLFTSSFSKAEDAIVQFVKTGKLNFKDFANSIIDEMIRIAAQQAVASAFGDAKKGTGLFGAIMSGFSIFAGGGAGAAAAPGMVGDFGGFTAFAAKGFDVPAGVNPLTQLHEKEMVLPQAQADVIRGLATKGGAGGEMNFTIVNQTTGRIDNVVEQRISPTERALIIQETLNATAGQISDPNSKISRSLSRNTKTERSRS